MINYEAIQVNRRVNSIFFILAVLLIFPIPQIAVDLYLPSLPSMTTYFKTTSDHSLLILTIYILSLGIAQLIYGPCSDRFGRKPVLLVGIIIFFLGNIACVFATSIWQIIYFRVVQGFGMGCGFVIASAILGESFTGKKLAKITTWSSTVFSLSILLAPILGGYLQTISGWRANFIFIAISSLILFLTSIFFIPETNNKKDPTALSVKKITFNYLSIVSDPKFMCYVVCSLFGYSIGITFSIVGPFLLQNTLHVSIMNSGILLFFTGLAYLAGTLTNNRVLNFLSVNQAIMLGIIIMLISATSLCIAGLIGWFTSLSVILFTCLAIFGVGSVFPNCFAKALELFPEKLGVASAIIGSSGLIGASLIGGVVVRIFTTYSSSRMLLGIMFIIESICCLFSYLLMQITLKRTPELIR